MQKFLFILLLFIAGYNVSIAQGRAPVGEDWKLSAEEANGMLGRLNECGVFKPCKNNSKVIDPNNDEYQWIVNTYGSTCNITQVNARYRDDDEGRYQRLRGLPSSRAQVKGYKTVLVKVEPRIQKGAATETMYFDCYTICPPPSDCSIPTESN